MKWIVWLVMFFSLSSFGQGVSKPPFKWVNIAGSFYHVNDLAPISGYTRIFARYEWTSGAFNNVLYVPRYNGVPTGAPTGENADIDGKVAIDTANSYFYYYSGGAWVKVAKFSDVPTNLTQFVSQGNWKLFYSNGSGDVTELALGTSGKVLTSNGATSAPTFETPSTVATAVPISGLTAATGTNNINNGAYMQQWSWNSLAEDYGLRLISNSTVGVSPTVFGVHALGANADPSITTVAADFINTHTGSTSTNIAAMFEASGGSTNYAAKFTRGRVSFGTAGTETATLELNGSTSGTVTIKPANAAGTWSLTLPTNDGDADQVLKTDGNGVTSWTTASGGSVIPSTMDFRLTTESGVPVSTTDRTSQGTIYMTPYKGNHISLYSGAAWVDHTTAEISLALTVTSGKNYDVFVYDNAGTITLELSDAWTDDNTRDDALTRQDGVLVKSGATTRRWIGTIRASGSNVTEDSQGGSTTQVGGKRFVWNAYNQVRRTMSVFDATDNWSYTTDTWRQANGAAGNQVEYVTGDASMLVDAQYTGSALMNTNNLRGAKVGVGVSSTTSPSGFRPEIYSTGVVSGSAVATYSGTPGLGYFYLAPLERGADGGSLFLGDNGGGGTQSGFRAIITN